MQGIISPQILLPQGVEWETWAVNACDQFTSDKNYWEEVERLVGDKPSTLRLIYPEIYLGECEEERISKIDSAMRNYLSSGVFTAEEGLILVERQTSLGVRTGVVLAIDLEEYDFAAGSKALIRSTEATILERIPPRVKIRQNAPIELPHVMLLYDDKGGEVLKKLKRGKTLYDFQLNMGGGRVRGTKIENSAEVINAFYSVAEANTYSSGQKILFAVGDGNHSLAAAKACWENIKKGLTPAEAATHPARYALAEAVNVYDTALGFKAIHRLVKTQRGDLFLQNLRTEGEGTAYTVVSGKMRKIAFDGNIPRGIRALDAYIAEFIKSYGGAVDYIHGEKELSALSYQGVGIALPAISKSDFFSLIAAGGNLPKKTFSMGRAEEKRYYIEARRK